MIVQLKIGTINTFVNKHFIGPRSLKIGRNTLFQYLLWRFLLLRWNWWRFCEWWRLKTSCCEWFELISCNLSDSFQIIGIANPPILFKGSHPCLKNSKTSIKSINFWIIDEFHSKNKGTPVTLQTFRLILKNSKMIEWINKLFIASPKVE